MLGGNFYDVTPYEGRYDAQPLGLFSIGKNNSVTTIHQSNLYDIKGAVKDIKWLRTAKGKLLLVAANNEPLRWYRYNPQ